MKDFLNHEFAADHVWRHRAPASVRFDLSPSAPPPRNYGQETRDTLQAQVDLAPQKFAAEQQFSPGYTDLAVQNVQRALGGSSAQPGLVSLLGQYGPQLQQYASDSASKQRAADIADIEAYGGRAVQAIRSADPQQQALLTALNDQALSGLNSAVNTDEVGRQIRAQQASRGFGFGNSDAIAEAFGRTTAGESLRRGRQGFAQQVAGLNAATAADPAMAVLGRSSGATNQAQSLLGQGQGFSPGNLFSPESAYAGDVFNTNYNADAARRIAGANNTTQLIGAGISAL